MQRGCIAIGLLNCDNCNKDIEHGERYLLVEGENNQNQKARYCVKCCLDMKYAMYITEKGEKILSFFGQEIESNEEESE
jgi:hypothetical protein